MQKTALVVGVSGVVGGNLAEVLAGEGDWTVYGLARRPGARQGARAVVADLQDAAAVAEALKDVKPTHVFLSTWLRQPTEAENIRVNSAMVRNVLDAVSGAGSVVHVATERGLAEPDLDALISAWHTDADLGRPIEVVTDMSKSRKLGFDVYEPTDESFFALFARLRESRIIP